MAVTPDRTDNVSSYEMFIAHIVKAIHPGQITQEQAVKVVKHCMEINVPTVTSLECTYGVEQIKCACTYPVLFCILHQRSPCIFSAKYMVGLSYQSRVSLSQASMPSRRKAIKASVSARHFFIVRSASAIHPSSANPNPKSVQTLVREPCTIRLRHNSRENHT